MAVTPPKPLVRADTPLGTRVKAVGKRGNAFTGELIDWTYLGVTVNDGGTKVMLPVHRLLGVYAA